MHKPRQPSRQIRLLMFALLALALIAATCTVEDKPADTEWDALVAPYRNWVDMDGYRMHYIDMGQGDPVLLVHGFADSTYCWHENLRCLLDAGFRVVLVDLPGLGRSELPPKDFVPSVLNLGEEILAFADKVGLDTFSLVGGSMGGGISLYLCLNHAERINRVVLVDPASFPQKKKGFLGIISAHGIGNVSVQFMGPWSVRMALKEVYFDDDKVDDVLVHEYSRPISKPGYRSYLVRLIQEFDPPDAQKMCERFDTITVPMLIVWGDQDNWVPPEFGPRLHKLVSGSRLEIIENAGHIPNQELPEVFNPLFVEFLSVRESIPEDEPPAPVSEG